MSFLLFMITPKILYLIIVNIKIKKAEHVGT